MPRLTIEFPDGLGRTREAASPASGDERPGSTGRPTATEAAHGGSADGSQPAVIRWHRCWAGDQ
ncbi:MAG: hypothetical protein ABEJ31_08260 [Haloarculaceae archaeon]